MNDVKNNVNPPETKTAALTKKWKKIPTWVVIVVCALIVLRVALPAIGLRAINYALEKKLGVYQGHIDDFDLSLYRGAYQVKDLQIVKRDSNLPPLLLAKEMDISLAWRALFHRQIAGDLKVNGVKVTLLDSKDEKKTQLGTGEKGWQSAFDVLVPINIESFRIENSSVEFQNHDLAKTIPVRIDQIDARIDDIRSKPRSGENSKYLINARLQGHAQMWSQGEVNLIAPTPVVDADFKLTGFEVNTVNDILRIYVPIDITRGKLDIYGETAMAQQATRGYVKVFFTDGRIIAPKQKFLSAKHFFFEIGGAFANWLLKNNQTHEIAAVIPFEGSKDKINVNASDAFWSTIKNKRTHLHRGIDHTISLENIPTPGPAQARAR